MRLTRHRGAGFSLIELLVAVTLASLLTVLALPSLTTFLTNTNIRSAAETVAEGLRRAQVEAVRRNANIEFVLDPATGWQIHDDTDAKIDGVVFAEGSTRAKITSVTAGGAAATRVAFSGFGRALPQTLAGKDPIAKVDIGTDVSGDHHDLRVVVSGVAGIKLCDPAFLSTDPKGCPG
jgi:type IV fimbrial biogenesis protein FimT